jgi:DHA1 family tetracycline resistance protein-like MFS transporter
VKISVMDEQGGSRGVFSFMRGNILVLTLTQSLGRFFRAMVMPYASLYVLALGGEPAQIGLINSLRPLAGLVMFPLSGYITDRAGRVRLIALAGYFSGVTMLIFVLAPSWEWIALASFVQGFMVFQFPPTSATIADSLETRNRGTGMATMNMIASTLAILSPYIAGILLEAYDVAFGMRILYALLAGASVVAATVNLRFLRETSSNGGEKAPLNLMDVFREAYGGIPSVLRQLPRSLKALGVVIILLFMCNGIAASFWVVYAVEQMGLSSVDWGLILLIEAALKTVLFIPGGLLVDRYSRSRTLLVSLAISLVSIPMFVLSTGFYHVLLIRVAVAVATVIFIPACTALMADSVPREMRGRVMAAFGRGSVMLGATGGGTGGPGMGYFITVPVMIASIAGGVLYTANPTYPWVFVFAATLISVIVSAAFIRDPKGNEA